MNALTAQHQYHILTNWLSAPGCHAAVWLSPPTSPCFLKATPRCEAAWRSNCLFSVEDQDKKERGECKKSLETRFTERAPVSNNQICSLRLHFAMRISHWQCVPMSDEEGSVQTKLEKAFSAPSRPFCLRVQMKKSSVAQAVSPGLVLMFLVSQVLSLVAPYCAIPRDYLSDTPLLRAMGFLVS